MIIENILTTIEILLILFILINSQYIQKSVFFILVATEVILNVSNEFTLVLHIIHYIYFIILIYYTYSIIKKKQKRQN